MRIGARLLSNSLLISSFTVLVTTILIGGMAYNYGKNILEKEAEDRLVLVRDLKANTVQRYLNSIENQAAIFSRSPGIIRITAELEEAFNKYASEVGNKGMDRYKDTVVKKYIKAFAEDYADHNGGLTFDATPYLNLTNESTFALQYNYIFNNPYGIDKESKLLTVDDGSTYSKVHGKIHELMKDFKEMYDFEDIFIVDSQSGNIVYTAAKGIDFTTSLVDGPFAKTALGDAFRRANAATYRDYVAVSDFQPYMPSNDDEAAFISSPIFDGPNKIGVLIFQINLKTLNDIMTSNKAWEEVGLGKTGETYLVDPAKRMMTLSRFFVEDPDKYYKDMEQLGIDNKTILRMQGKKTNTGLQILNTQAVNAALNGNSGFEIYKDYRGVEVIGAYAPIKIGGITWAIISEVDTSEAYAPVQELAKKIILNLLGIMVLIMIFAFIVGIGMARQISLPIERLSSSIRILSKTQDLTQRIPVTTNDEIGEVATSLNHLIETFQQTCQETITSTQKMQFAAHKLMALADEIDSNEEAHKHQGNYAQMHEKTEEIKDAGDSLAELSTRLQVLSRQFKVFEAESDRTSGW